MAPARSIGLLAAWLLASLSPAAEPRIIRVTGDRVNLRAQPAPESEVVGQMMAGELLATPDPFATSEWVRVVAPQSVDLWVYSELIRDGRITVNKAQVRGGPGLQFKRVGELTRETPVVIRGALGDWTRIAPTSDCFLWVSRSFTEPLLPLADEVPAAGSAARVSDPAAVPAAATPASANESAVPPAVPVPLPETEPAIVTGVALPPPLPAPPSSPAAVDRPASPVAAPPRLPPSLSGYAPDGHRPQNRPARYTGRLSRIRYAAAPAGSGYQIVSDASRGGRRDVLCRMIGLDGQLDALAGCQVEVHGILWHLAGVSEPVLDARRLLMLAPPP